MKRIKVARGVRRPGDWERRNPVLPLDPRDPDVLRVKALEVETLTLAVLFDGPKAADIDDMEADRLLAEHLQYTIGLREAGHFLAAGAMSMIGLGNRVHTFARPNTRDRVVEFFTDVLGCGDPVSVDVHALAMPVLGFRFANGASLSVEFTEAAPNERHVHRGAWLELVADDPVELKRRIIEAGLPRVEYLGSEYFYFQAPGGQVMRIVAEDEV